jgi:membrane protease YdiL (CAAX protease family)
VLLSGHLGVLGTTVTILIPFAGTAFIGAVLVLLWARLSRTPMRDVGFVTPRSWTRAIGVRPLPGADPINHTYYYLVGNVPAAIFMALFVTVSGGFGEETIYRGFLFQRFCKLLKSRPAARPIALVVTSLWFAGMHYPDQGVPGVEQAIVTGLVFGTMFIATRSITLPMVTHAVFDLTAIALIYCDLETRMAHVLFK